MRVRKEKVSGMLCREGKGVRNLICSALQVERAKVYSRYDNIETKYDLGKQTGL